jgi:hypothetical protein
MIEEKANSLLLKDCFDIHIHSYPDIIPRKMDDFEVAYQAKKAKMAGILIKNHFDPTTSRALLVQKIVGEDIKVFGGCVLNYNIGGLNPEAVNFQIKLGAKEIWMPTVHARNHLIKFASVKNDLKNHLKINNTELHGISILDKNKKIVPKVYQILELVAKNNVILGTGHLSVDEIVLLINEAKKIGVEKILVTHPEWWVINMPIDIQTEIAKKGVFFERCLFFITDTFYKKGDFSITIDAIKKIGVKSTILATDFGQMDNPTPIFGLIDYFNKLKKAGFSQRDLDIMTKINPSFLLGLNEKYF